MGETHIKQELPDTCILIERYNFFSTKLHDYSSFDEFVNDLEHKSNFCNFHERANIIRDIIIFKVAEFNKEGLLPLLKDSLTLTEIVSLCRDTIRVEKSNLDPSIEEYYGKIEVVCSEEAYGDYANDELDIKPVFDAILPSHEQENDQKSQNIGEKPVQCFSCDRTYETLSSLNRHARKSHPNAYKTPTKNRWPCGLCQMTFARKIDFKTHEKQGCDENLISTNIKIELNEDDKIENDDERRYPCSICNKYYKSNRDVKQHISRNHIIVQCDECDEQFNRHALYKHKKKVHKTLPKKSAVINVDVKLDDNPRKNETSTNICPTCNNVYKTPYDLKQHIRRNHVIVQCDQCDEQFNRHALYKHKRRVHDKPPECTICHKSIARSSLSRHMHRHRYWKLVSENADPALVAAVKKKLNNGKKGKMINVPCHICGKVFRFLRSLQEHMRIHKNVRNYACKECPKRFVSHRGLASHRISHSTTPTLKCRFCEMLFRLYSARKEHENDKHLGLKPFTCSFCKRSFTNRTTKKYHERLHTGECPFKCSHCDKAFAQPNGLKSHMKTHVSRV